MRESSSDIVVIPGISETQYHPPSRGLSSGRAAGVLLLEFGDQKHLARLVYVLAVLDADADGHGAAAGALN